MIKNDPSGLERESNDAPRFCESKIEPDTRYAPAKKAYELLMRNLGLMTWDEGFTTFTKIGARKLGGYQIN